MVAGLINNLTDQPVGPSPDALLHQEITGSTASSLDFAESSNQVNLGVALKALPGGRHSKMYLAVLGVGADAIPKLQAQPFHAGEV